MNKCPAALPACCSHVFSSFFVVSKSEVVKAPINTKMSFLVLDIFFCTLFAIVISNSDGENATNASRVAPDSTPTENGTLAEGADDGMKTKDRKSVV